MIDQRTDEELFEAARNDNCLSCFETLYRRYWKQLYREAYRRLQNKEESEDCLQDVFTSIWNSRHKITIQESFGQYVHKVLFNKVVSGVRRKILLETFLRNYSPEPDVSEVPEDGTALLYMEINRMPAQMRKAILLSKIEGRTAEEISDIMGINVQSVRNHIHLGMNRLKKNLKKC